MWIRSQDKSSLVNINGGYTNGVEIVCFINGGWINLGTYRSEERALEVLDMIQNRIIKGATFDSINNSKRTTKEFVFQMPEE